MKILKFIKSLLPRFKSDRVIEDARITEAELNNIAIPSYKDAVSGLKNRDFKSKQIQEYSKLLKRNIKSSGSSNIVSVIHDALVELSKNHANLQKIIENDFEEEVLVEGISILKLNVIRILGLNAFCTTYALKFLNLLYVLETQDVNGDEKYVKDSLSAGDIIWLDKHFLDFCFALNVCSRDEKDFTKVLEKIPEVVLGVDPEATLATLGDSNTDPFNTGVIAGFTGSPIYSVRLIVAEYQANRYKEKKELKTVLELRLMNLKKNLDKNFDAALEKEILYTQSRIDSVNDYIRKAEGGE